MLKELFQIFGTVAINNKDANKALDDTTNKGKKLAASMATALEKTGSFFVSTGKTMQSVGSICNKVTLSVTGVLTAAAVKANNFISVYESARAIFERKLGSTGADQMYESLLNIAKGSRYAQEYIVGAGQTLIAMGVDANNTAKYVQIATDAMSGMGKSGADVQAMAEMFGKMSIQTTLYTEDLNQMLTSGIRVYDILAAKYKTNTDAIKEMASAGELTSKDFEYLMDVLAGNVEGMEEFSMAGLALAGKSSTLTGAIDSLNSSFRSFALNLLGMNINKGQMENYEKLKEVVSTLGSVLENVGEKFSFVSDWIKSGLSTIKTALDNFNNTLNSTSPENLERIAKIIAGLAAAGPILTITGKGVEGIGNAFSGLSKGIKILGDVNQKISGFSKYLAPVKTLIDKTAVSTSLFAQLVKFNIGESFSQAFPKISGSISKISGAIGGIPNALSEKFPRITSALNKISGAFSGFLGRTNSLLGNFMPVFRSAFSIAPIIGLILAGLGLLQSQFRRSNQSNSTGSYRKRAFNYN